MNKLEILCWLWLFTTTTKTIYKFGGKKDYFSSPIKMDNLRDENVLTLKDLARNREIPKYYLMKKAELITAIEEWGKKQLKPSTKI